jgi:hypothetical protein
MALFDLTRSSTAVSRARDLSAALRSARTRGVHNLDHPCKHGDSAATTEVTAHRTDHAERLRG